MKKLGIYTLALAAAAVMGLSSCSNNEDLIFDDSAAERLDKAKNEYMDLLTSNGGKWVMEYFVNPDDRGFSYVMTFSPSGSVTMTAANEYVGSNVRNETSLWDVITDDGVVLTFNSYNSLFHLFSEPDAQTGLGMEGDYEFIFLSADEDGNTIHLKGKKHSMPIVMRRLAADTDVNAFMAACAAEQGRMFNATINTVVLNHAPTGERFIVMDGASGIISIYPEGGDDVTQTETCNAIITADGLRFMVPFSISRKDNPNDSITIQSFKLQPDGSLLCDDENDHESTITGFPFAEVLTNKGYSWAVDTQNSLGYFATAIAAINDEVKDAKGTLTEVVFGRWDDALGGYCLDLICRMRKGAVTSTKTLSFAFTASTSDNAVTYTYKGQNSDAAENISRLPSAQALVDYLGSHKLTIKATNVLAPAHMELTGAPGDVMLIDVK